MLPPRCLNARNNESAGGVAAGNEKYIVARRKLKAKCNAL
jgi:hypothetical protein